MSISTSLSNAVAGMSVASRMAELVSSNVANSLTEGYGRRSLNVSSSRLAGVEVGGVTRHVDHGTIANRRLADAERSGFGLLAQTMRQIEQVVGQAGDEGSIAARIVAVESALIDAAADPSSTARLAGLVDKLDGLANGLNAASNNIQSFRAAADANIAVQVDSLNTALRQVEQLNTDITYARNTGADPSGLQDQRQVIIDGIAEIVPIRQLNRDAGQVALMTPSGQTLLDGTAQQFGFVPNAVITADMTYASGGLSGLTLDGAALLPDGLGKMAGGSLGAAFEARDGQLVAAQKGLDVIAADLMSRFQDPTVDPTLNTGDPGLFTDNGANLNASNMIGLSGRIQLNGLVDPDQGGAITRLRDGLNATSAGPAGNANVLQSLSGALADPRSTLGDPTIKGLADRAASNSAEIGVQRLDFEADLSFANSRWSSLKEAEAAGGVDTDFEMQMLLRVEQAYAANARVIQAVESMMQRLMEI